jgi:hypothetical protein
MSTIDVYDCIFTISHWRAERTCWAHILLSGTALMSICKSKRCLVCERAVSGTAVRTALVYYCNIAVYIQGLYIVYNGAGVQPCLNWLHCRKSWRNISFPSDISELFHEDITTNISEKFSP